MRRYRYCQSGSDTLAVRDSVPNRILSAAHPSEHFILRLVLALRQKRDEVCTLGVLLQTGEHHLRPDDVLLRVDQELVEVLGAPVHARALHCVAVSAEFARACVASDQIPKRRTLLRCTALLRGVALRTLGLEPLSWR